MRIALLARRFDPAGGGTERDLMVTAGMLARAGHQITVYADEVRASAAGVEVRRIGASGLPRAIALVRFAYAAPAAARRDGAELVLSFARTIGADILRSGGGAHVSYVRAAGLWRGTIPARAMRLSPYHRAQMIVERKGFHSPALRRVISVSNLVRDDLVRSFGISAQRVVTMYNGVDLERFKPAASPSTRAEIRMRYGIPAGAALIAFVGNGFARKGLGALIEAIAGLANDPYLIVVGSDRARAAYERRAARLGIQRRVIFAGAQPNAEQFYQAADAFAFPSLFEPFGNVALEAMACGIPALTSASCGVAELMPPELQSAVVDNPADANEVTLRLGAMLAAREALGPIALAAARQFTWQRHEHELLAIIESAARGQRI
ncbi:MAG TPA: glycosyltransferase family 4 protein [Candidatus Binataceae bacterium]|nr:glycosyltransferase family 4 protein [Candidatus Binataceae bacterium]